MMARPLRTYEVVVIALWSTTSGEKLELVETCNRYDIAPLEAFQLNVGLVETPVAPLPGKASIGAAGAAPTTVVSLHTVEYALVPPAFVAFTHQ